jgi:integrase
MSDRPMESWRARAALSEALEVFNSTYMQEIWSKALARRENDPEGAVTSARTLLESLCKHILEDAGKDYKVGLPLPELYKLVAEVLDISPDEDTEPVFNKLFTACAEVIRHTGNLRNFLSDAHGRGPFGTMPDWRHAELAVNLSGAMATYIAAVWKGRQLTVADVIRSDLENPAKERGQSLRYRMEALARSAIGEKIASKLRASDIVEFIEQRHQKDGVTPTTLNHDLMGLRSVLADKLSDVFDEAQAILRSRNLTGVANVRKRRYKLEEYEALIEYFRKRDKHRNTKIPMADVMEFAVCSGRLAGEIFELSWSNVDFNKRTGKLPDDDESFPLLNKAWDIVQARHEHNPTDERIFPYNHRSAIAAYVEATTRLGFDLTFNDLRYEAVCRLLESGHPPHMVSRATGMGLTKVDEIHRELEKAGAEGLVPSPPADFGPRPQA